MYLFSIMAGILSMDDVSKVGKLGLRALLYFMFTTVIAVTLGLGLSTLVKGFLPLLRRCHEQQIQGARIVPMVRRIFRLAVSGFMASSRKRSGGLMQVT